MEKKYRLKRPTIGVLASWSAYMGVLHTFYGPMLHGIQVAAQEQQCNLLLTCGVTYSATHDGKSLPDHLIWPVPSIRSDFVPVGPWNTDGLIVATPYNSRDKSQYIEELVDSGFPVVIIGTGEKGPGVYIDNEKSTWQALTHLFEHGHRRIACLYAYEDTPGDGTQRLKTYYRFMREHNLPIDPRLIIDCKHHFMFGRNAIQQMLQSGVEFTAVLASNDEAACGVIHELHLAGRRVPEDVAVIGFDDRLDALTSIPPLTTTRYPLFETGFTALELLLQYINGQETTWKNICMPTQLIIRESCGCHRNALEIHAKERKKDSSKISGELAQALQDAVLINLYHVSTHDVRTICTTLAEAFVSSLLSGDENHFLVAVQRIFAAIGPIDDKLYVLLDAMMRLRQEIRTFGNEERNRLETMFNQAYFTVTMNVHHHHSRYITQESQLRKEIGLITIRLHAALDETQVFRILAESLTQVGIRNAHVAFFEPEENDPMAWSTLRSEPERLGVERRFPTRAFPPRGLYQADELFHLVLLPLNVQGQALGFVAIDADRLNIAPQIVLELSVALKTARLYREADEGRRLAEEANRLKTRFLSTVSHELRIPLSQIVGRSELLLKQGKAGRYSYQEYRTDIERINASAQHLGFLIRDVLDLSSSEIGQLRLFCEPLHLKDVLEVVAQTGEQLAHEKGLQWCYDIPERLPYIWGDRTRLRQIILNLVTNAIKFTAQGSILLKVEPCEGQIRLTVSDTGLGIPFEEQKVVFDAFRQSERTTMRRYGGLGLGLAICKQLITLHAGAISVQSTGKEGEGSTFYVTLPILDDQHSFFNGTTSKQMIGHRVLLLTKGEENAISIQHRLSQQNIHVDITIVKNSLHATVSEVEASSYHAVLLDERVAVEQGWEIVRQVKNLPSAQDTPVLFYKMEDQNTSGSRFEVMYLTKPVETEALTNVLVHQGIYAGKEVDQKTILIVDDDPGILDIHARMIQLLSGDYHILKATNGRDALKIIEDTSIDLILLDLMMPGMDGFEVLEVMRSMQLAHTIPVVVLTAQILTESEINRLNRGVSSILQKSVFTIDEILSHLEKALARENTLRGEAQRLVRSAMAYIHTHYTEVLSRGDIARHVHVSEDYLTRCFQQEMEISPMTYLNRYRVSRAKLLLEAGKMSISDIALAAGFSDSNHFGRVFRREVGMSPGAYQRHHLSV